MEIHRIILQVLARDESQAEHDILPKMEFETQTLEPQEITRWLKDTDNLVDFPIVPEEINYLLIRATYTQDDPALGVKRGDLAPFFVRVDGDTTDRHRKGLYLITGDVIDLKVGTAYATNKIEIKVAMG